MGQAAPLMRAYDEKGGFYSSSLSTRVKKEEGRRMANRKTETMGGKGRSGWPLGEERSK